MMTNDKLNTVLLGLAVTAALVMTGITIYREIRGSGESNPATRVQPVSESHWQQAIAGGYRRGSANPKLLIVAFTDFECPFCRRYENDVLQPLLDDDSSEVAVIFRHWPLAMHPRAFTAARLAECSAHLGKFWAAHDLLYEVIDSLDSLSPTILAERLEIVDGEAFVACATSDMLDHKIASDTALVRSLGGVGTPAVLVNGRFFPMPPSLEKLRAMLD